MTKQAKQAKANRNRTLGELMDSPSTVDLTDLTDGYAVPAKVAKRCRLEFNSLGHVCGRARRHVGPHMTMAVGDWDAQIGGAK